MWKTINLEEERIAKMDFSGSGIIFFLFNIVVYLLHFLLFRSFLFLHMCFLHSSWW